MTRDPLRIGTVIIGDDELSWRFSRSSGPGGQSVNTTDSRATVAYDVARSPAFTPTQRARVLERLAGRLVDGVLTVTASDHRSQLANRKAALARLVALLEDGLAPPAKPRRPTRPSRSAVERRLSTKKRQGDVKRLRRPPDARER
ncbi:alternative ribosome rescue aminoacyl-tRNA hydrolase ArfB [Actinopolymorpha alba]|uniref:alternative ribosome rescue aminoacyl-tRNA hydrolase ArfB n=1 Tax=Actinopolymorpha alba TaxID=533267 RepID=UPI000364BCAC|nr:alternative ribosome rescue aminoacyl-tRNA hydrolase ArfB [Actinopolymorpha alba]